MSENNYIAQSVHREQVRRLFDGLPTGLFSTLFVALALTAILWPVVNEGRLLAWLFSVFMVCIGRFGFYFLYKRHAKDTDRSSAYWEMGFTIGVALTGLLWGVTAIFLYPDDIVYQVIISFVLAGMSAGAIATVSFRLLPIRIYLLLTLLPLIFQMALSSNTSLNIMALMVVMFLVLIITSANRIYKSYEQQIMLSLQSVERENLLQKHVTSLQALHEISTDPSLTFDGKVNALLMLGIKTFDLEGAIVSHIKNDVYTVKYVAGESGLPEVGDKFDIGKTYSAETFARNRPYGFHHAGESAITSHPCYQTARIEAYVGVRVYVDGEAYGTLNFTSTTPRKRPFSEHEFALVQLFAQWIGNEMTRSETEEKLAQFKTTLDLTKDCVFMFEPGNLLYNYVNQGAMDQVGYDYNELMTMTPVDIKPEINASEFKEMIEPLLLGEKSFITYDTIHQHKNGGLIPVEIFLQYIEPPEEEPRFIAIVHDITERKRIDKMKDEFISTVSHELRTPLTSIRGSLGLVLGGMMGQVAEEQKKMLLLANSNTDRLLMLINDILDIQKISKGKVDYNYMPLEANTFLKSAIGNSSAYAEEHKVNFLLDEQGCSAVIDADYERLMQVMANLLSNAAKFSPPHSDIKIACEIVDDMVRISVADSGPGIPQEFQEQLFEKFTQLDSSDTRETGGTGLGLSIARLIVEQHGGRIDCDSEVGAGSTFYFELPIKENAIVQ